MSLLEFLKSKVFFKHFIIANVVAIALISMLVLGLDIFTKHGEFEIVPDFRSFMVNDINKLVEQSNITYVVNDSFYNPKLNKGVVLEQDPPPGTKVKPGRKVYLTINSFKTPEVAMPNLIDLSLRQATSLLETYGLKLGKVSYVNGFPPVIEQRYKGRNIKPGEMIERGSEIDLVAGKGDGIEEVFIPDLFGLTLYQLKDRLNRSNLILGNVFYDEPVSDTLKARVYKQSPDPDLMNAPYKGFVDVWLTESKSKLNNEDE
ncbi:MAG: PASTA domain-containing protein [Flavobacteriales bacterium]